MKIFIPKSKLNEIWALIKKRITSSPQWLLAVSIICLGILIMFFLIIMKKPPERKIAEKYVPLVEVTEINKQDVLMIVKGYGTVSPKVQVEIVPQVAGKVVSVNPQFKIGGFIKAGEEILKIDPRDYELAVQQAQATVAEAIVKLDLEQAEAKVAKQEWDQLNPGRKPSSSLVLREPQIRQAKAKLESAKATLASAKLNLERTSVSLPIDVMVMNEKIDLGQYVVSGQSLGSAYGIDALEVELPLEDEDLAWFDVPNTAISVNGSKAQQGAKAKVKANFAGSNHTWYGYVSRTTGQVDKMSRLVSVVIEIPKPFDASNGGIPLLPGTFVEVLIEGRVLENTFKVPRDLVRNKDEVWVVEEDKLRIKTLKLVRSDREFVYAISGINDGARVISTSLDVDITEDGIDVKVTGEDSEKPILLKNASSDVKKDE